MSSPHVESFSTIPEATDDLWPLLQENNSSLVLEPSMFHCQDHSRNIGKGLLTENRNVHRKDDKDNDFSTSIHVVDQWSFLRGSSSLPPAMDYGNGYKLDSILVLEQEISAILPNSETTDLFPALIASDYACSLSIIEDNARTDELDSSAFISEPVDPNIEEGSLESRLSYPIDDSLSAPPEDSDEIDLLLKESSRTPQLPSTGEETRDINDQTDIILVHEQESSAVAEPSSGKGLIAKRAKTRGTSYRFKQGLNEVQGDKEEGSIVKKQVHNAKERIRRMKLHESYLALGALLPDSSRSKKRKSAPLIIDRTVEYIPELEEEIEKLTLRKNDMLSTIKSKQPVNQNPHLQLRDPSVSVHEIRQGELIVQICTRGHPDGAFSTLLHKVEEDAEGMRILSASTLHVSDDGVCCHLHLQMNDQSLDGGNHLESLRQKVISWLC